MKQSRRAYLSAWLLLSVFVPMVLLSSVHVHPELAAAAAHACHDCVEHQVHDGHLDAAHAHIDCFLCHFNSNVYLAGDQPVAEAVEQVENEVATVWTDAVAHDTRLYADPRGPPALVL